MSTLNRRAIPAGPWSVPRMLRSLAGVDETILDSIPTERPRYTAMGGVVLGTAVIAMFSMGVALSFVFGGALPRGVWLFIPIWGAFILSLDRWLMATASAVDVRTRVMRMLPRVLLAVAIGVVVAEPLLLSIFNTAIVERTDRDRKNELLTLQSELLTCNPVPGTPEAGAIDVNSPRCAKLRLSLTDNSLQGQLENITKLLEQVKALEATIQADTTQHAALEAEARKECNGTEGPGLSGRFGEGPNCRRLRAQADAYRADHRIDENTAALADLRQKIDAATTAVGNNSDAFAAARQKAIDAEVVKARDRQKDVGLLERMRALGKLTSENGYAEAGEWALRIFLIIVDALPVLVKLLSGFTTYDSIVAGRLREQEKGQEAMSVAIGQQAALSAQVQRYELQKDFELSLREIDLARLKESSALTEEWQRILDKRAQELVDNAVTAQLRMPNLTGDPGNGRRPITPGPRHPDERIDDDSEVIDR